MKVGVAAIKGTYKGKVGIVDKQPPTKYTLQVEGSGGPGFVKGTAKITLEPTAKARRVRVDGDGQVGGMLAGVGQRMLPGVAKMLMNQFFECLIARLERAAGRLSSTDAAACLRVPDGRRSARRCETILDRAEPLGLEHVDLTPGARAEFWPRTSWPTTTCRAAALVGRRLRGHRRRSQPTIRSARRGDRGAAGACPGAARHRGAHHDRRHAASLAPTRWSWSRRSRRSTARPCCSSGRAAARTSIRPGMDLTRGQHVLTARHAYRRSRSRSAGDGRLHRRCPCIGGRGWRCWRPATSWSSRTRRRRRASVRDSNRYALMAAAEEAGAEVVWHAPRAATRKPSSSAPCATGSTRPTC